MFRKVFSFLAIFMLFFGVVSTLVLDVGAFVMEPTEENAVKIAEDLGESIFNSQEVVKESYLALEESLNGNLEESMSTWLFFRVIAGSLVTLAIIWILWKGLSFLAPSERLDLGTKIIIMILILVIIWGSSLIYSYSFTDNGFVPPFHGWLTIAGQPETAIDFLSGTGYTSPIERVGLNETASMNDTINETTNGTG